MRLIHRIVSHLRDGGAGRWTSEQRAQLVREYARIGRSPNESWPTPRAISPEGCLVLLRTIPDGAGRQGWIDALAARAVATRQ